MKGEVVYLYAFDVANEIVPGQVGPILGRTPAPLELRLKRAAPKDVAFHRPLAVELPSVGPTLDGRGIRVEIHVHEIGIVNVALRAGFEGLSFDQLPQLHRPSLNDGRALDRVACELCADVCRDLAPALVRPSLPTEPEAYTVFCLSDLDGERDVERWLAQSRARVAGLLANLDSERLSESFVAETMRLQWSQSCEDRVVIDWDAALIVDLAEAPDDVLFVLEVANLQLEEFRALDRALDSSLNMAYEDLERRSATWLFGSKTAVLRKLRWFRIDLSKLADEVTNITKFIGDWHLARIYLGARERFHLDRWRASVDQRLLQLDQLYNAVQSEVFDRRMLWLEVLIVIFFAIDLIAILWLRR